MDCVLFIKDTKQSFLNNKWACFKLKEDIELYIRKHSIKAKVELDSTFDGLFCYPADNNSDLFLANELFNVIIGTEPFFRGDYLALTQDEPDKPNSITLDRDLEQVATYDEFLERILKCLDCQLL